MGIARSNLPNRISSYEPVMTLNYWGVLPAGEAIPPGQIWELDLSCEPN